VINRKPLIDGPSDEGLKPENEHLDGRIELRDVSFSATGTTS
jgi:hypothetical protein